MSNLNVFPINASPPTNVLIGTSSVQAVAENTNRQGLVLTNISGSTMYLALMDFTATLHAGITLTASGGV